MSTENVKEVVREKYGQAALRAKTGAASSCCGGAAALEAVLRPDHVEPLRRRPGRRSAGPRAEGVARMRQSHGACGAEGRARRFSISAPAAASTCCSLRGVSGRRARPTAST